MKAFVITVLAVLGGIWIYSRFVGRRPRMLSYVDPQTGKTVTVAEGTVDVDKNGDVHFEGPDVDNLTGAYLPPGAQPGTVQFPVQGN